MRVEVAGCLAVGVTTAERMGVRSEKESKGVSWKKE